MKKIILLILIVACTKLNAQTIEVLQNFGKTSFRGLSIVSDKVMWASGSGGTVVKSTDGGKTFEKIVIPNFEKRELRDIEAFDSNTAVTIAIAEPAQILKTIDGGKSWTIVFTDSSKGMFLDAMYFANKMNGIIVGDPINGKAFIAETNDGGNSWMQKDSTINLAEGEAFFAASGTNVLLVKNKSKWRKLFVSGGKKSHFYDEGSRVDIPINQGKESTGANSIAAYKNNAIIVGGDFAADSIATNNCVLINLENHKISMPDINPVGYKSCVCFVTKKIVVSCGTSGVDISYNAGIIWKNISKESYHTVATDKKSKTVFLVGGKGKIAKLIL